MEKPLAFVIGIRLRNVVMADGATANVDLQDKSEKVEQNGNNKDKSNNPQHPPYLHSISRSSLTFFNSENAKNAAKAKFEVLRTDLLAGSETGGEDRVFLSKEEEKKLVDGVLNFVCTHLALLS